MLFFLVFQIYGFDGTIVEDGEYKVWMELTDKNATGNYSSFTFNKSTTPEIFQPANVPSFSSITITWEPLLTSVEEPYAEDAFQLFPNPTAGPFQVKGDNIHEIKVYNASSGLVFRGNFADVSLSEQPDGLYYVQIFTDKGVLVKKLLKK